MQSMAGKIAVVTGGGGGIGSAISRRLAKAGARVIIPYRGDAAKAEAVLRDLPGSDHMVVKAAIDNSASLATMAELIRSRYGSIDLLVNNAGMTKPVPHADLDGLSDELFDDIMRTNVRGAFACTRAMRGLLEAEAGGVVVNISSIAGTSGIGSNIAYCASKAAMNTMTISLARALAPRVRVVAVAPGWVLGEYAKKVDPAYLREQTDKTPLSRLASADDVAETVLGVATMMPFTTGAIIPIDGGRMFV